MPWRAVGGWSVVLSFRRKRKSRCRRQGGREGGRGLTNGLGNAVLVVGGPVLCLEELDKLLLVLWWVGNTGGQGQGREGNVSVVSGGVVASPFLACTYSVERPHVHPHAPELLRLVVLVQDVVHLAAAAAATK